MFERVLTATDLLEEPAPPVLAAARLARRFRAALHIIHVLESADPENRQMARHFQKEEAAPVTFAYEGELRERLMATYGQFLQGIGAIEVRITPGYPWEEILAWSDAVRADLIVMGPHSARAKEKGVVRTAGKMGGTSEGVVMNERCPVMLVGDGVSEGPSGLDRILVSVDFSRSCLASFRLAVKLAEESGAGLFLYHMLPVPPDRHYTRSAYAAGRERAEKRLQALAGGVPPGIACVCRVKGGAHPHLAIAEYAKEVAADLVLMGSHTKEKPGSKWYVGSVVERVAKRAFCPVIVITDPEAAGLGERFPF